MRSFDLKQRASTQGGEYVLGMKDLYSQACYLIYGILDVGEGNRLVQPGDGHEEILCAVDGPLVLKKAGREEVLEMAHAIQVKENESFFISNPSDRPVVYVMAGGHCRPHH